VVFSRALTVANSKNFVISSLPDRGDVGLFPDRFAGPRQICAEARFLDGRDCVADFELLRITDTKGGLLIVLTYLDGVFLYAR
jgi:hypothetical protein